MKNFARSIRPTVASIAIFATVSVGIIAITSPSPVSAAVKQNKDFALDDQWGLQVTNVKDVWPIATGFGVIVAVVDSGSGPNPDLDNNLLPGRSIIRGRVGDDTSDVDTTGHGTHVAGIIAAQMNNDIGIAGVAPNAQILPVRILDSRGDGSELDLAVAIRFAVDQGARVINLSLGGKNQTSAVQSALEYAASNSVLVVASAGNGGPNAGTTYPAGNDLTIAVTAVDQTLNAPSFAQRGSHIDISAPGINICSTIRTDITVNATRRCAGATEPFLNMSGTSMAAAFVSGIAALVFSARPTYSAQQVREVMVATARDLGLAGRDETFGVGLVDAYAIFKSLGYFPDEVVFPTVSSLGHVGEESVGGTVQIPESERLQWYRCLSPGEATLVIPTDCKAISRAQRPVYLPTRKDINAFLRFGTLISVNGVPQLRFSATTPKVTAIWTSTSTMEVGGSVAVKDLVVSASPGATTARVVSGSCRIAKNVLTTFEAGVCKLRIFAQAKKPYPKLSQTVVVTVVQKV
ncbi:MAG: S8 family serine peptidase [Actinobacteria bacterium]|nr:S8 family serine peptidase [Actinomycetota bacterium]